jgi:hypothetical protein
VATGLITHPTNSHPAYLDAICRPALAAGAARSNRATSPRIVAGGGVITAPDTGALASVRDHHRRSLAFLYSTPPYRRTLELLGVADLARALRALTRSGEWDQLPHLLPDDLLDRLVVAVTWSELPERLAPLRHVVDGILLRPPDDPAHDPAFAEVLAAIRSVA